MALPPTISDREFRSFEEAGGEPAKRVKIVGTDLSPPQVSVVNGLAPPSWDYLSIANDGTNITQLTYYVGGSLGTLVRTVDITWDSDFPATIEIS